MTDINKLEQMVVDIEADVSDHIIMSPSVAQEHAQAIQSVISQYRRMEKALRPFAAAADDLSEDHWDELDVWESPASGSINGGHLRAARQVLQDQDQ